MNLAIRPGELADLPTLTEIYNHYIRTSLATFDTMEFTDDDRRLWFDQHQSDAHQLLVADLDGRVAGYATSSQFRAKPAYAGSVETTVYISAGATGQGIGRELYDSLLGRLEKVPGLHRAYAGIAIPNPGSVALHTACGFSEVGTFSEAGFKHGSWVDVRWFQRPLGA